MQAPKDHYSDEYVVLVELETHNTMDDTQNAERDSTKDQQLYIKAIGIDKCTIKPPTRYGFEDLVSYALNTSSGDPTNFRRQYIANRKVAERVLWKMICNLYIRTKRGSWWNFLKGRGL